MEKLFEMYLKTYLLTKGFNVDGLSSDELLGMVAHVGEPKVQFDMWAAIVAPPATPDDTDIDEEINSELNRAALTSAAGNAKLQNDGILSIKKVG